MGVDVAMFARIKGRENWLQPADELAAAYQLAATVGPDVFVITKGRYRGDPDLEHHALSIVRPLSREGAADDGRPDLEGRVVWWQDGPPIVAGEDEQFVRVHLRTRYYGERYPRGSWPVIRAVAEWLERRFAGCEVWYGGDSSGICAEPFGEERRRELNAFYLSSGQRAYAHYRGSEVGDFNRQPRPLCARCEVPMADSGGAKGVGFWSCDGCGEKVVTRAGEVHRVASDRSHSQTARELDAATAGVPPEDAAGEVGG